eukprot:3226444-Prymnesium_polylepis.1
MSNSLRAANSRWYSASCSSRRARSSSSSCRPTRSALAEAVCTTAAARTPSAGADGLGGGPRAVERWEGVRARGVALAHLDLLLERVRRGQLRLGAGGDVAVEIAVQVVLALLRPEAVVAVELVEAHLIV